MRYTIQTVENKVTKDGKAKLNISVIGEDAIVIKDVTVWPDHTEYSRMLPGFVTDGTLDYKTIKGRTWVSLHEAKNANGTFKPQVKSDNIQKAIETKSQNIAMAQDKKMEGIKDSSTFRAATDHVIQWRTERLARGINTTTEEWQTEWINVRKWFDARFSEPFN